MSDEREDPEEFFARLKEKYGIDFEEEMSSGDVERARELVEEESPPSAPILEIEELDEEDRYPGSKQALKPLTREEVHKDKPTAPPIPWEELPSRVYTVQGRDTTFYTIGALAAAMQREVVTLRKWEQKGYLPPANFRAPSKHPTKPKHDRLYTREQIEGLVKILEEEGLLIARKKMRIDQTNFPERAHALFERLAQQRREI